MNTHEIRTRIEELLVTGTPKSRVFAQMSGQGVKDAKLAHLIASHADPERTDKHSGKVKLLVGLMLVQAVFVFLASFGAGAQIGPKAQWIVASIVTCLALWLAWGFADHRAWAYNAYIMLTIVQLPRSLAGLDRHAGRPGHQPRGPGPGLVHARQDFSGLQFHECPQAQRQLRLHRLTPPRAQSRPGLAPSAAGAPASALRMFRQGALSALTNPKAVLFFSAFLPQFIDPQRSLALQVCGGAFVAIGVVLPLRG